jgi:hypothetical protein
VAAAAEALARQMWDGREVMQAALISPAEAVAQCKARLGEANPRNPGRGVPVGLYPIVTLGKQLLNMIGNLV